MTLLLIILSNVSKHLFSPDIERVLSGLTFNLSSTLSSVSAFFVSVFESITFLFNNLEA